MAQDEEILRLLREIRDEQEKYRAEWQRAVDRAEQRQQLAREQAERARRNQRLVWIILAVVLTATFLVPMLRWDINMWLQAFTK